MINQNKENQIKIIAFSGIYGAFLFCILFFFNEHSLGTNQSYLQFADAFLFLGSLITTSYIYIISESFIYLLADIFNGAPIYAPITFIMKLLSLYLMSFHKRKWLRYFIFLICSQLFVLFGYFFYDLIIYHWDLAVGNFSFNLLQVIVTLSIGSLLGYLLLKSNLTLIDDIWIQ